MKAQGADTAVWHSLNPPTCVYMCIASRHTQHDASFAESAALRMEVEEFMRCQMFVEVVAMTKGQVGVRSVARSAMACIQYRD